MPNDPTNDRTARIQEKVISLLDLTEQTLRAVRDAAIEMKKYLSYSNANRRSSPPDFL